MKTLILALCLLPAVACGYEGPDYRYKGLRIYTVGDANVDMSQVAILWDRETQWWNELYGRDFHDLEWTIYFTAGPVKCQELSKNGLCNGLTWAYRHRSRVNAYQPCLARTAMFHEAMHLFLSLSGEGDADANHLEPALWEMAGGMDSLEWQAEQVLSEEMHCPQEFRP